MKKYCVLLLFIFIFFQIEATQYKIKTFKEYFRSDCFEENPKTLERIFFPTLYGIVIVESGDVYTLVYESLPVKSIVEKNKARANLRIDSGDTLEISDDTVRYWGSVFHKCKVYHRGTEKTGRTLVYGPFDKTFIRNMDKDLLLIAKEIKHTYGEFASSYTSLSFENFDFNPLHGEVSHITKEGQKWTYYGPYQFWGATRFLFKRGSDIMELSH